jgi:hypothetical protein
MRPCISVLISIWLASPFPAFGWWETGHRTVARIAVAHLSVAARIRVARILDVGETPEAVADELARASTWADETKTETKTGAWHYIDIAVQDRKSDIPARCKDDNCAPARIRLFAKQLASQPADSHWSQLDALRFLVHFVGDMHQPLHTIDNADLGGNCELLNPVIGGAKNLHALWDGEIVNAMHMDDKDLAAELDRELQEKGDKRERDLSQGNPNDWAWESHEIAKKNIYHRLHIPLQPVEFPSTCDEAPRAITRFKPQIDELYIDDMKPVVRSQLEKAGLRLARLLNESL